MSKLRVGKPAKLGDVTLIPLFCVQLTSVQQPDFLWFNGTAEPFGVVIVEQSEVRAVGVDASELAVDVLLEAMPDLDSVVQQAKS